MNAKVFAKDENETHQNQVSNEQKNDQDPKNNEHILRHLKIKDIISSSSYLNLRSLRKLLKKVEKFSNIIKSAIKMKVETHANIRVH